MDEHNTPWHVAQIVSRWLAIVRQADRQSPSRTQSQPLDEFLERVDDCFVSLDHGRKRLHTVALEQQLTLPQTK